MKQRTILLFILSSWLLSAQTKPGLQKFEQVATQLQLTPEQKLQLIPILKAEAPRVKAIEGDTSASKLQKIKQLRAVYEKTEPQVKSILTPQQYQKLQEILRTEIWQAIRQGQ
jgi:hypothetical protein